RPTPIADFTVNNANQCQTGHSFVFTNNSSISAGTMNYSWDFGNGATATTTNPTRTYPNAGNYTVKLKVTSGQGCESNIKSQNIVLNASPKADFDVTNNCEGVITSITNKSSISS